MPIASIALRRYTVLALRDELLVDTLAQKFQIKVSDFPRRTTGVTSTPRQSPPVTGCPFRTMRLETDV